MAVFEMGLSLLVAILIPAIATILDWILSIFFARKIQLVGIRSAYSEWGEKDKEKPLNDLSTKSAESRDDPAYIHSDYRQKVFLFAIQNDEQVPATWFDRPAHMDLIVRGRGKIYHKLGFLAGPGDHVDAELDQSSRRVRIVIEEIRPMKTWYFKVFCSEDTDEIECTLRIREGQWAQRLLQRMNEKAFPSASEVGRLKRVFVREKEVERTTWGVIPLWLLNVANILPTVVLYTTAFAILINKVRSSFLTESFDDSWLSVFGAWWFFGLFFVVAIVSVSKWTHRIGFPIAQGYRNMRYLDLKPSDFGPFHK